MKVVLNKFILCLLFLLCPISIIAFDNDYFLAAGFGFSEAKMHTKFLEQFEFDDGQNEKEDETTTVAVGVTSRFGKRFLPYELGILSDIGFGKVSNVKFLENQTTTVEGKGHYRYVSVSPYIKYNLPYKITNTWELYSGIGPQWSLQTIVLSDVLNNSNFNTKKRISFENFGAGIFIGIEENLSFKEMHPTFLELGFAYAASYKVSVIDASNFKDVKTLSSRNGDDLKSTYFFVRLGIILF